MAEGSDTVGIITKAITGSSPSNKLILFGGIWVTLAFFSSFLKFPVEMIMVAMSFGGVAVLIGFFGAVYAKKKEVEQSVEIARLTATSELSHGDMEMLAILNSKGPLREHDIFNLKFPYDDKLKAAEIRGKHKVLRVKYLVAGGHVDERGGDFVATSGSEPTIMAPVGE